MWTVLGRGLSQLRALPSTGLMSEDLLGRRGNMVARRVLEQETKQPTQVVRWYFHCPGCEDLHCYTVGPPNGQEPRWTRTGSDEKPSFAPSLLVRCTYPPGWKKGQHEEEKTVCHLFLREGVLEFLGDCTHTLKNQKVPLPEPPVWLYKDENAQSDDGGVDPS